MHKELQTIEETKQFAGNQTLVIQEENERLSIWCHQLEQDSLNNKKRIAQIEKRLAMTRSSNESMRLEIASIMENLEKSQDLLNPLQAILSQRIDFNSPPQASPVLPLALSCPASSPLDLSPAPSPHSMAGESVSE